MARPSASDRIADMAIELITQRTRAEAAEAELRDLSSSADRRAELLASLVDHCEAAERDAFALRLGLMRAIATSQTEPGESMRLAKIASEVKARSVAAAGIARELAQ